MSRYDLTDPFFRFWTDIPSVIEYPRYRTYGIARFFCNIFYGQFLPTNLFYPFTAPATTPSMIYFWHAI